MIKSASVLTAAVFFLQPFLQAEDLKKTTGDTKNSGTLIELKNPGFEDPFSAVPPVGSDKKAEITGMIAEDWHDNSDWADLTVAFSKDDKEPHGGKSSQKISISRVASGAVQLTQDVDLKSGHQYEFHVWMRGDAGAKVSLLIRQHGDPYTTYAEKDVTLTADWKEYVASGQVTDTTDGFLMFLANAPMTFSIDDVQFYDTTDSSK